MRSRTSGRAFPKSFALTLVIAVGFAACGPPTPPNDLPVFDPIATTTAVGTIPATSFVDDAGQFHWRMSIPTPPGRAGVEPHLGVEYTGSMAPSSLGVGFALTGLSSIARCAPTLAQDGRTDRVRLDDTDPVCLDGQRLRAQGAQGFAVGSLFHTERETWQQIQIIAASDVRTTPAFLVTSRDGTERRYGTTADSRVEIPAPGDARRTPVPASWLLAEERDTNGNIVQYHYEHVRPTINDVTWQDLPTRDLVRIARIVYTGYGSDTLTISGTRQIEFEYGPIRGVPRAADLGPGGGSELVGPTSPVGTFFDGSFGWPADATPLIRVRTFAEGRLTHLLRFVGGDGSTPGIAATPAHEYRLDHIQLCAQAPASTPHDQDAEGDPQRPDVSLVCLPPTTFDWMHRELAQQHPREPAFGFETFEGLATDAGRMRRHLGRTCHQDADGFNTCVLPPPNPVIVLDVNGDGADDVLYLRDAAPNAWEMRLGVPSPSRATRDITGTRPYEASLGYQPAGLPHANAARYTATLDFNADGRDDILIAEYWINSQARVFVYLSDGHDFTQVDTGLRLPWAQTDLSRETLSPGWYSWPRLELADVNGDGRQDIVNCQYEIGGPVMNFDRMPDPSFGELPGRWIAALRTDGGFAPPVATGAVTACGWEYAVDGPANADLDSRDFPVYSFAPTPADFDGDGRAELVIAPPYDGGRFEVRVLRLAGDGSLRVDYPALPHAGDIAASRAQVADFNGDGLSDLFINHTTLTRSQFARDPYDPPLAGVTDVRTLVWFSLGDTVSSAGESFAFAPYVRLNSHNATELATPARRTRAGRQTINSIERRYPLPLLPFEMNGDGRADLIFATLDARDTTTHSVFNGGAWEWPTQTLWVDEMLGDFERTADAYPTTAGFVGEIHADSAPGARDGIFRQPELYRVDADGDGALDLLVFNAISDQFPVPTTSLLQLMHNIRAEPSLVTAVHDGYGSFVRVRYTTLSDRAVYTPATTCSYPQRCVTNTQWVVSHVERDAGLADAAAVRTEDHRYEDARVDLRGRGFLGFARHVVTMQPSGEVVDTRFDNATFDPRIQDYPFAGRPARRWSYRIDTEGLADEPASLRFVGTFESHTGSDQASQPYAVVVQPHLSYSVLERQVTIREFEEMSIPADPSTAFRSLTPVRMFQQSYAYDAQDNPRTIDQADLLGTARIHYALRYQSSTAPWRIGLVTRIEESTSGGAGCAYRQVMTIDEDVQLARPTRVVRNPGDRSTERTVTPTYDSRGNVTAVAIATAADGTRTSAVEYDAQGYFPISTTNALGHETLYRYHAGLGTLEVVRDPNHVEIRHRFDGFGRPRFEDTDGEAEVQVAYSQARTVVLTIAGGGRSEVALDRLGRPTQQRELLSQMLSEVDTEYDTLGNVVRVTEPREFATTEVHATLRRFDGLGRLRRTTDADGVTTHTWQQPRRGFRQVTGGGRFETWFDSRGLVAREIEPTGGATTDYTYCATGALRRVTGAGSRNTTDIAYDTLGRRISLDDPSTGHSTFAYDAWDELRETVNAAGDDVLLGYDSLGRVIDRLESYVDGSTRHAHWDWDTALRPTGDPALGVVHVATNEGSANGETITDTFEYDEQARLSSTVRTSPSLPGTALALSLTRDDLGRTESITYPTSISSTPLSIEMHYDSLSGEVVRVSGAGRDLWRMEDEDARGSPTNETIGGATRATAYTAAGRIRAMQTGSVTSVLQDLEYAYDARGLLQTRSDHLASRTETILHDALGRIRRVTTQDAQGPRVQGFDIDRLGNLRHAGSDTVAFDDAQHPQWATSVTTGTGPSEALVYDAAGRVTTAEVSSGDRRYVWNADDLPRAVEDPKLGRVGFAYSADGERALKSGPQATLYMGGVYELTIVGLTLVERYYVPTPVGMVAAVERSGVEGETSDTIRWMFDDRQGSTETTWVEGQAAEHIRYDAYGGVIDDVGGTGTGGPTPDTTHGFTGHEHDGELGLINMGGRIYDPRLRRFLTGDPMPTSSAQGLNRYSYVHNQPFDLTDPSGWQAEPYGGGESDDIWPQYWCSTTTCGMRMAPPGASDAGAAVGAAGRSEGPHADGSTSEQVGSGATESGRQEPTDSERPPTESMHDADARARGLRGEMNDAILGFVEGIAPGGESIMGGLDSAIHGRTGHIQYVHEAPTAPLEGGRILGGAVGLGLDAVIAGGGLATAGAGGALELLSGGQATPVAVPLVIGGVAAVAGAAVSGAYHGVVIGTSVSDLVAMAGGQGPVQLGQAGQAAAGITGTPATRVPSLTGTAAYRIPDAIGPSTLNEVKNVSRLFLTRQMRDLIAYGLLTGRRVTIVVRAGSGTRLAQALIGLEDAGRIVIDRSIP